MMKSTTKAMLIMLLITGLVFGGIFGWKIFGWHMMNRYFATMKAPPVTVSTIKAEYQAWQPQIKASGSLRAVMGVDVTTEVPGMVSAIHFTPGTQVKGGNLLLELNANSDLAHLHALQAAADLATTISKRDKALFTAHAISKATLDADLADLKNKTALVEEQTSLLNKKTIKAPFAGRLGVSRVNLGMYMNPGDKIVTLQALDPIYVDFYVPQQAITQVAVNQPISLRMEAYPNKIFVGKITTIDPKIDPATRNIQVEASLPNPDSQLLPGMFAAIECVTGEMQRYLTLPQTAISYNPYGEIVYVAKQSGKDEKGQPALTAVQSFVTVGETRGDQVAILSGISQGDVVVSTGQHKLKSGTPIVINNTVLPSNNPNPSSANP